MTESDFQIRINNMYRRCGSRLIGDIGVTISLVSERTKQIRAIAKKRKCLIRKIHLPF